MAARKEFRVISLTATRVGLCKFEKVCDYWHVSREIFGGNWKGVLEGFLITTSVILFNFGRVSPCQWDTKQIRTFYE